MKKFTSVLLVTYKVEDDVELGITLYNFNSTSLTPLTFRLPN